MSAVRSEYLVFVDESGLPGMSAVVEVVSMTPKSKRPQQSPEPIVDRESPVLKRKLTGIPGARQRAIAAV